MFCRSGFGKMVSFLIFSFGDLNNLGLQVIYPSFYLLQIFLHPFTLTFIIPVHLVCDDLKVAINNQTRDPYYFSEIKSCHQGFTLTDHAFNLVSFWRTKYDTCLFVGRFVRMYTPSRMLVCPVAFLVHELCNEVSDDLPLNGRMRTVLYVKLTQLYYPQC